MKEWMAQANPPKEASNVKKIKGRSILLSSNKWTHYFKEQTAASSVFKKIYCLYKNLKQILLAVPVSNNCSTPTENSGYKYSQRAALWRKQLFRKSSLQLQCTMALLKYLLYLMNNHNCCCEIVKLKLNGRKCFRAFNTVLFQQKLLRLVLWNKQVPFKRAGLQ